MSVTKIASMLEKACENTTPLTPRPAAATAARFARDPSEFTIRSTRPGTSGGTPLALVRPDPDDPGDNAPAANDPSNGGEAS